MMIVAIGEDERDSSRSRPNDQIYSSTVMTNERLTIVEKASNFRKEMAREDAKISGRND